MIHEGFWFEKITVAINWNIFFVTLRKCCSFFLSFFFWIKDISLCYILEVSFCSRGILGSFLKWNLFSTQLQLIKFALQQQQQTKMFSFFHYTFSCFYATKIKFLSFINFYKIWIILSVLASFESGWTARNPSALIVNARHFFLESRLLDRKILTAQIGFNLIRAVK